jgi:hypothetical protein
MQCGVVGNRLVTSPVKVSRAAALSSLASYTPEKKLSRKQSVCSL